MDDVSTFFPLHNCPSVWDKSIHAGWSSAVNHIRRNVGFYYAPMGPRVFLRAALCVFTSSQWVNTVNIVRHHGHLVSKPTCQQTWYISCKMRAVVLEFLSWWRNQSNDERTWLSAGSVVRLWCGSQSAVCVITGETVFYNYLNNTQTGRYTHTDVHAHTHCSVMCGWNDSYTRVFVPRAANNPGLQPLARTDSGSAVGLPDWWKRHSEEESSAAIGQVWSHQSRCADLHYLKLVHTKFGYASIFNWCNFCVCHIICVCRWWRSWIPEGLAVVGRLVNQ